MWLDVLIALSFDIPFRFSRVLRPLLLVVYSRKLRQMIQALVETLPSILDVMLLVLFLIVTFDIVSIQLFAQTDM